MAAAATTTTTTTVTTITIMTTVISIRAFTFTTATGFRILESRLQESRLEAYGLGFSMQGLGF